MPQLPTRPSREPEALASGARGVPTWMAAAAIVLTLAAWGLWNWHARQRRLAGDGASSPKSERRALHALVHWLDRAEKKWDALVGDARTVAQAMRTTPPGTTGAASSSSPTAAARPLPDFSLPDSEGRVRTFSALTAGRPTVVYFYSAMCGHCNAMLPRFAETARGLQARGITVVGVQYMGTSQSATQARQHYGLVGDILADGDGAVCGKLGVGEFTVFALDRSGMVRYRGDPSSLPPVLDALY